MKAWKKLAALMMALGMTVAFAACGGDKGGDNGSSDNGGNSSSSESATETPEELSETEMDAAIENLYAETNFTIVGMKKEEEYGQVKVVNYTAQIADGKVYQETQTTVSGVTTTTYSYVGLEDGVYYDYYSMDNENWDKEEYPVEAGKDPTSAEYIFSDAMQWAIYSYHLFEDGENVFRNLDAPELRVKVIGGKIVEYKIYYTIGGETNQLIESAVITYGNAVVGDLPTVEAE